MSKISVVEELTLPATPPAGRAVIYFKDGQLWAMTSDGIPKLVGGADSLMVAHVADGDPHPQYQTQLENDARYESLGQVAAHEAAGNPHAQYLTPAEADAAYEALGASTAVLAGHTAAGDPHPQYLTAAEGNLAFDPLNASSAAVSAHLGAGDPHPQYLTQAEGTSLYETVGTAAAAVASHAGAADPHPGYLTPAEGAGLYEPTGAITAHAAAGDPHPQYLTSAEAIAAFDALGSVTTHEAAVDPHPQYLTPAEANIAYAGINHIHATGNLLVVSKTPAANEYSSIAAALAAVVSPSASNRWLIKVGPGEYTEPPFSTQGYVYISGNDPWNSAVIKTNDLTNDFITVAPNSGLFNIAVSGPTTAGKSAIKQTASGTTKLYWVNIKEGSYGVTMAPTTGTGRCHCIGVVTDGPAVMNRMFNCDNPGGVGVFILMQSGPMITTWTGTQPSAVYINGNGTIGKANVTLDLCQFRGTMDAVYADNAAVVRGICCSFAQGATAVHVGPNGASKVDIHGSQIKPAGWTKDIWVESTTAFVSYSGVATESKLTIAAGATFVGSFADADPAIGGQVIYGELWIGNTSVKTPLASYIQADKNTGLVSGGTLSRGAGTRQVDVAAGVAFIDTANGLKKVSWNAATLTLPANSAESRVYVNNAGAISYSLTEIDKELNVVLGECGTNATDVVYVFDATVLLPQFRPRLYEYMEKVIGPINISGGLVTPVGLGFNVSASTYFLTEVERLTPDITGASFTLWYRDGAGGWVTARGVTSINATQYDDGSGTLATMTAGYYRRDLAFVCSHGMGMDDVHVVMGQQQFATLVEAVLNPISPDPITEHACRIAGLTIQKSASTFVAVDQRPKLGQMASGSSGITNHNDLAGRDSASAHTQYQLVSEKGNPNGYADLDAGGLLPSARLPAIAHGNQAGGALHSNATTSVSGFMSGADKTKLDSVATGATVNSADSVLKDRANHTGAQSIATVTGLQTALDGKDAAGTATAAVAAHLAAPDPHPQYLTAAEGAAAYSDIAHVHAAAVAAAASGYMTGADKSKLDGIAAGATANNTDANLLNRANHTGAQATSTITGLDTALAGKEAAGVAAGLDAAHLAAGDPHPQYLTPAEGAAAYSAISHGHADAVAGGASGYLSGTDKSKLDSVTVANIPTANEKAGLAGTSGTAVSGANKLVDSADSRMTNARTPIPQGATKNVQFNNAGTMDGATEVQIDPADDRLVLAQTAGGTAVAAPASGLKLFARRRGGRNLLNQVGPAGVETALQVALFSNRVSLFAPQGNSTVVTVIGMPTGTAAGQTARNVTAGSNLLASMRRIGYVSGSTGGSLASWREAIAQNYCSNIAGHGGFFIAMRFGIPAMTTDGRWFVGLDNGTAAPTNTEPSGINNTVGFGCNAADTNVQAWSRASANITTQNTAIAGKTANAVYEARMFCKPNSQVIGMSLERLDVAGYWEIEDIGAVTANQAVNTLLGLKLWVSNGGTAQSVAIDICSLYKETDN